MGIESASPETRKDMVKRLEEEKVRAAFTNLRAAGHQVVRVLHLRLPGRDAEGARADHQLRHRPRSRLRQLLSGRALPRHRALREGEARRPARQRGLVADGVLVLPAARQRPRRGRRDEGDQPGQAPLLPAAALRRAPRRRHRPPRHHQVARRRRDRAAADLRLDDAAAGRRRDRAPATRVGRQRGSTSRPRPDADTRHAARGIRLLGCCFALFVRRAARAVAAAAGRRRPGALRLRRAAHPARRAAVPRRLGSEAAGDPRDLRRAVGDLARRARRARRRSRRRDRDRAAAPGPRAAPRPAGRGRARRAGVPVPRRPGVGPARRRARAGPVRGLHRPGVDGRPAPAAPRARRSGRSASRRSASRPGRCSGAPSSTSTTPARC